MNLQYPELKSLEKTFLFDGYNTFLKNIIKIKAINFNVRINIIYTNKPSNFISSPTEDNTSLVRHTPEQRSVSSGTGSSARAQHTGNNICSSSYFFLSEGGRSLTQADIMNLRLVSLDTRKAIFEHDICILKITVATLKLIERNLFPRLYPSDKPLKADVMVHTAEEFETIANFGFTIKRVTVKGDSAEDTDAVLKSLPTSIEHLVLSKAPLNLILDLDQYNQLKSITINDVITGKFKFKSSNGANTFTCFNCGTILKEAEVDLSDCENVSSLQATTIYGIFKSPSNLLHISPINHYNFSHKGMEQYKCIKFQKKEAKKL